MIGASNHDNAGGLCAAAALRARRCDNQIAHRRAQRMLWVGGDCAGDEVVPDAPTARLASLAPYLRS